MKLVLVLVLGLFVLPIAEAYQPYQFNIVVTAAEIETGYGQFLIIDDDEEVEEVEVSIFDRLEVIAEEPEGPPEPQPGIIQNILFQLFNIFR